MGHKSASESPTCPEKTRGFRRGFSRSQRHGLRAMSPLRTDSGYWNEMTMLKLLTLPEVAIYFGYTPSGLRKLIRKHNWPHVRIGRKTMFRPEHVEAILEAHTRGSLTDRRQDDGHTPTQEEDHLGLSNLDQWEGSSVVNRRNGSRSRIAEGGGTGSQPQNSGSFCSGCWPPET